MTSSESEADDVYGRLIDAGKEDQHDLQGWVESYVDHEIDFLRAGALRTLAFHWRLPQYRSLAADRLRSDPSDEVRQTAAMGLGAYGWEAFSAGDMSLLVEVALDQNVADIVRAAAFTAALVASRIPREQYPMARQLPDFEARAPWQLVAQALERVGLPSPPRLRELLAERGDGPGNQSAP